VAALAEGLLAKRDETFRSVSRVPVTSAVLSARIEVEKYNKKTLGGWLSIVESGVVRWSEDIPNGGGRLMSATSYAKQTPMPRPRSALNVWLWIAQALLATFFLLAGCMHAFMPIEQAAKIAAWIAGAPAAVVRFIGIAEIAGAFGLILPAATRVKPWLTPLAAACLALIMVLAMPVHIARGEVNMLGRNIAALAVATFVAWGRTTRARIASRSSRP
jgi:uncharacterized membrane protein